MKKAGSPSDKKADLSDSLSPSSPASSLSGVAAGGSREAQLHRLSIYTVGDLLQYYPRMYQNRGDIVPVSSPPDGEPHSYMLTVTTEPRIKTPRRGMSILTFRASDESGTCEICFFNQYYLKGVFSVGARFRFYGKITFEHKEKRLTSPIYEAAPPDKPLADLVPVYALTAGLTQKALVSLINKACRALPRLNDHLPEEIRARRELAALQYAISGIHFPKDGEMLERSRRRLVYDEFFMFALRLRMARAERIRGSAPRFADTDIAAFTDKLKYSMTGAQRRAVDDIIRDLRGESTKSERCAPMCRIVVGDVGCGKTAVAAAAAYVTVKNGYQCVLMAPTEILARQHYIELSELFSRLGYHVTLLVGSMKDREKRAALDACAGSGLKIGEGRADLIIGTHALISDGVKFDNIGLVITDEQHRFGAMQRAALAGKGGEGVHTLVLSATPIPRTLSLVLYGDLDISIIDEMPPGRSRVDTFAVNESYRPRLTAFIRRQITDGHQVYIVCPAVGDGEDDAELGEYEIGEEAGGAQDRAWGGASQLKEAVGYASRLSDEVFPDLKVGFVHGRLKGEQKDSVMSDFAAGRIDILVSTTVIEVGVNVPNATLMIVENAERFGLSQLHQLRGRVGRGSAKSYCVLVSDAAGSSSRAGMRLETMKTTYDGFKIAEQDLALRGPGDFLPHNGVIRQHGGIRFKLARADDPDGMKRLSEAFDDAGALLASDPSLSMPEHLILAQRLLTDERAAGDGGIIS